MLHRSQLLFHGRSVYALPLPLLCSTSVLTCGPIVGESLVEVSVDFMLELGLGAYLVEEHYPKYGLTYYFKPDIDNPADRTYVVDEIPTAPQILSFQINRFTFDREARDRNVENGVELIDGTVTRVDINGSDGLQMVTVQDPGGGEQTLSARWLVDATGRNRGSRNGCGSRKRSRNRKMFSGSG